MAALKLRKRWTWPRQLPLGVGTAATSQPSRHGSGIEVGGLAAHEANLSPLRLFRHLCCYRQCGPALSQRRQNGGARRRRRAETMATDLDYKYSSAMPRIVLDKGNIPCNAAWEGNNVAFTCPHHKIVFIVSGQIHPEEGGNREVGCNYCPALGCTTAGRVWGGRKSVGYAWLTWEDSRRGAVAANREAAGLF